MKRVLNWGLLILFCAGSAHAEKILFAENFSSSLPTSWKNLAFFSKKTDYTIASAGTNHFLHAVARNACSAFSEKLHLTPATSAKLILRWRWKIDGVNTNGSERDLARFDHAARIFVAFDTFIGPPLTLNYLWGDVEKTGTLLSHPKSSRAKIFVVESGNARAGQWLTEERDVTADWRRAFPERKMPKIVGLGVMTDSDSLGQELSADYANIRLIEE